MASKKILIVQLSHNNYFKGNLIIPFPEIYAWPPKLYPMGLGHLSNALKNASYDITFLDLWIDPKTINKLFAEINKYDVIGFSYYVTQYIQLKNIVEEIRKINTEIPIIVGGPGAEVSYEIILKELPVDFVVFSEAEISLINLLNEIYSSQYFENVKGIAYKKDGKVVTTGSQEYIKDLDSLEFPDLKCLDFEAYIKNDTFTIYNKKLKGRVASVISGRGCPYKCTYCSRTFSGARFRSVENILEEVKYLKENYNIQYIKFQDELLITSKQRVFQLCEGIKELDLKWKCQGRVNMVDSEILKKMNESGCVAIGYGFENATQRILDTMKKKIKAQDFVRVYKMTKDAGIVPVIQYMYGYIGENDESLQNSIDFFSAIDHPAWGFYVQPIPGTDLYDYCIEEGLITDEKKYLEDFMFGYNKNQCTINLSQYPNLDMLNNKIRETHRKIDSNYYKRHPIQFSKAVWNKINKLVKKSDTHNIV